MKIWEPKAPGNFWATPGQLRDCFTFTFTAKNAKERSGMLYTVFAK
jgi:hypothetical protein